MAKKVAKKSNKKTAKKAAGKKTTRKKGTGLGYRAGQAKGKSLVIVESPSKAKTINKYLGPEYVVLASVGHVRDLPSKGGRKDPVPGVDLEHGFKPTYEVLDGKDAVVRDLKRAAKDALSEGGEVWFATDLDREGEAIAWHLAQELGIKPEQAKRVVFTAITKNEIQRAFANPHTIDTDKVNAQQARRILDRIVGYQVSPLLWKKVARGLSAGRVQSVAVRLVVEKEREIRAFLPEEYWQINACFCNSIANARTLMPDWSSLLQKKDDKGNSPTLKSQNQWLSDHKAFRAELIEIAGDKFDPRLSNTTEPGTDITSQIKEVAQLIGLDDINIDSTHDEKGKGLSAHRRTVSGTMDPQTPYKITSISTKRTKAKPPPPYITSTLQQAASTRLGFGAQRTMRAAQQLYEGIEIPGEGPVGLITYMRTDSTHISGEALSMARDYISQSFGSAYLPDKPNFYSSSNKAAQEAHEAIRPTALRFDPKAIKSSLKGDQLKLYSLIWERFIACQMTQAQWDSTTMLIQGGRDTARLATFRLTGRMLAFDGFYKVAGVPPSDTQTLPALNEGDQTSPFAAAVNQRFTTPPARYTEASLIKTLESEGIGRPSTYASIIQVIQSRNYAEQIDRRFYATDLGMVVTDKLVEAFPQILDIGYTRQMENELDKIEEDHLDWVEMLERFYGPFASDLEKAHENLLHAKAEITPAPDEYRCAKCDAGLVYRFGRNGRFLSCSRYPDCDYACPCDRDGKPAGPEITRVVCPNTGRPMIRKNGRFGPFLTTLLEDGEDPKSGLILNLDKHGHIKAPSRPALVTDLPCPICESPLNLRSGVRGPWLGCSKFPKCRGRGKWTELEEAVRERLISELEAHDRKYPIAIIRTDDGKALTDEAGRPLKDAPKIDDLIVREPDDVLAAG